MGASESSETSLSGGVRQAVECNQVPAQPAESNGDSLSRPKFVGVYPRGFASEALAELALVGASVETHHEAHCALIFLLEERDRECVDFGTFSLLFELVGEPVHLTTEPTLQEVSAKVSEEIVHSAQAWRNALRPFKHWRCDMHRDGVHGFKSPDIVPILAEVLSQPGVDAVWRVELSKEGENVARGEREITSKHGPSVDLKNYDVEVVAFLADGLDTCQTAADWRMDRAALRKQSNGELFFLGVRSEKTMCRSVPLQAEKGSIRSKADNAVAFCVAYKAAALMTGTTYPVRLLDPMCGVGTYLLALRWVHLHRRPLTEGAIDILGGDVDSESIAMAYDNAIGSTSRINSSATCNPLSTTCPPVRTLLISFLNARSDALPLATGSIDLIVTDPPWGQRHSIHSSVKKLFPRWAREWARVLRPGGIAVIVTICAKLVGQVFTAMRTRAMDDRARGIDDQNDRGYFEVKEVVTFNNKGWTMCKLYVAVRS